MSMSRAVSMIGVLLTMGAQGTGDALAVEDGAEGWKARSPACSYTNVPTLVEFDDLAAAGARAGVTITMPDGERKKFGNWTDGGIIAYGEGTIEGRLLSFCEIRRMWCAWAGAVAIVLPMSECQRTIAVHGVCREMPTKRALRVKAIRDAFGQDVHFLASDDGEFAAWVKVRWYSVAKGWDQFARANPPWPQDTKFSVETEDGVCTTALRAADILTSDLASVVVEMRAPAGNPSPQGAPSTIPASDLKASPAHP